MLLRFGGSAHHGVLGHRAVVGRALARRGSGANRSRPGRRRNRPAGPAIGAPARPGVPRGNHRLREPRQPIRQAPQAVAAVAGPRLAQVLSAAFGRQAAGHVPVARRARGTGPRGAGRSPARSPGVASARIGPAAPMRRDGRRPGLRTCGPEEAIRAGKYCTILLCARVDELPPGTRWQRTYIYSSWPWRTIGQYCREFTHSAPSP